jgi:hypothetical protein
MFKSDIKRQAFAMKSRPDILIFQGESVGGHENTRKSREEQKLGEKRGFINAWNINIKQMNMCSKDGVDLRSFWSRSGVLWDRSGGQEVCVLMGHKNFEVPERVDIEHSTNIAKVRKLKVFKLIGASIGSSY